MTIDLPPGWTWARLEDLVAAEPRAITDGPFGSNLKTAHYTDSGPRVIRLQNIGDGVFKHEHAHISQEHYMMLVRHSVREGDLVVASLGETLPRACLVPGWVPPAIVKADCIRVRLHPDLDSSYINFALQRPGLRHQTTTQIKGVGRPRLGLKGIRNLAVPVAPLSEQQRIVAAIEEHFSRLDAVDISLDAAEMRCHALTRSIIVGSIPNELPEDWQLKTIAEAGETGLGRQRSPKYHSGPNMKPYLRVANVFEDRIDTSSIMEMHFEGAEFDKYRLRYGDVLLNEGQSPELLGRPAIYMGDPPDTAFTNSLIRFVPGPGVMSEWALLVFRRHMHARRFMRESRITTNIAHLALGRFRTVEFPVPPLKTQQELVASTRASLSSVDQLIDQIRSARARTKAMRRAVLAVAFSGHLVPPNPKDEPASVLLERIAASRSTKPNRRASARQMS